MDVADLSPLLGQLENNLEDLEIALEPLLRHNLSEISAKLPLLDKAKLHVLVTYAIESILFSYLRLHGTNAKEHPVYRELTRVKQYFEKIKAAEKKATKRENLSLDKQAAGRIIKHALAANEVEDRKRAEGQAEERARAHEKAEAIAQNQKAKRTKDEVESSSSSSSDHSTTLSDDDSSEEEPQLKRQKHQSGESTKREGGHAKGVKGHATEPSSNGPTPIPSKHSGEKKKKRSRKRRKVKKE
ncbi:MAG: hypothetical protein M1816_000723 [Peltula sp. TS41687]|nr:MAG: hypothetical protein M1816_000723 [Peltula sp. TS41687]